MFKSERAIKTMRNHKIFDHGLSAQWKLTAAPAQLIYGASRMLQRLGDARLRVIDVKIGQLPVMAALRDGSRKSQKELAELASVEQPTMAQILKRMDKAGLIDRKPHPEDGRSSEIGLTPLAISRLPLAAERLRTLHHDALQDFDSAEIATFISYLQRVVNNLSKLEN